MKKGGHEPKLGVTFRSWEHPTAKQLGRKWGSSSYDQKELNSADNPNEQKIDSFLELPESNTALLTQF